MRNLQTKNIDAKYIKSVLLARSISSADASRAIGRSPNYIANICRTGRMLMNSAEFFCKTFGADIDKLIVKDEPERSEQPVPVADAETIAALAKALISLDRKVDLIMRELGVCQCGQK